MRAWLCQVNIHAFIHANHDLIMFFLNFRSGAVQATSRSHECRLVQERFRQLGAPLLRFLKPHRSAKDKVLRHRVDPLGQVK